MVELAGRPLIAHALAVVEAAGLEPIVVAKPHSPLPPLSCRVVREPEQPTHPLLGIVTALARTEERPAVVLACDMPLVPAPFLEWLAGLEADLAVPRVGTRVQPLMARYRPAVAKPLQAALGRGAAVHEAVLELDPRVVTAEELAEFGEPELICLNVNTPADLERAAAHVVVTGPGARR